MALGCVLGLAFWILIGLVIWLGFPFAVLVIALLLLSLIGLIAPDRPFI